MILVRLTILALALFSAEVGNAQYSQVPETAPVAQTNAAVAPVSPADVPSADAPPGVPPAGDAAAGCVPTCREGYMCHQGQCISACNPTCGPGLSCTQGGQCVAPQPAMPAPQPAYDPYAPSNSFPQAAPSAADEPPPPGGWEQPEFESRKRSSYHFRPFAGLTMNVGGFGVNSNEGYLVDRDYVGRDYDLDFTAGFEAGFEFRFARVFGIAPAIRLYSLDQGYYSASMFDLLIQPTFHIPIGMIEILIPISLGPEFASDPNDNSGTGFTFGVTPGIAFWVLPFLGFHAQFGFGLNYIDYTDYSTVAVRYVLNTGVDFAF